MDNTLETTLDASSVPVDQTSNGQEIATVPISPTSPSKKRKNKRNKRRNTSNADETEKQETNGESHVVESLPVSSIDKPAMSADVNHLVEPQNAVASEPSNSTPLLSNEPVLTTSSSVSSPPKDTIDANDREPQVVEDSVQEGKAPPDTRNERESSVDEGDKTNGLKSESIAQSKTVVDPPPAPVDKKEIKKTNGSASQPTAQKKKTMNKEGETTSNGEVKTAVKPSSTSTRNTSSKSRTAPSASSPTDHVKPPSSQTTGKVRNAKSSPSRSPVEPSSRQNDGDSERPVRKMSATDAEAAGHRLYENAKESKRKLEAKKAAIEEAYTFTPQVTKSRHKEEENGTGGKRFVQLHELAKQAQRKQEELREKIVAEQCSFKPEITQKARRLSRKKSVEEGSRYENLYQHAREIQEKREAMKQEASKKEEEGFTFKPKITQTKSPVKSRPLYDAEREKQKRMELEQKKKEAELSQCTFKPKTVATATSSKKQQRSKEEGKDSTFYERLYHAGQERSARLAKLKQEREDQEKNQLTFKPKVSSSTSSTTTSKPFHERLYDKDHVRKVVAEREQKQEEFVQKRFSFKPQISDLSDDSKTNKPPSTGKSIFERLYEEKDRVKEKIELSEELKIQKELEECTFRPQIDVPGSNKSEASTPIWERLTSIDKNQIIEERERKREQLELQDCTFKPDVTTSVPSKSPTRGTMSTSAFDRLSATEETKQRKGSLRSPQQAKDGVDRIAVVVEDGSVVDC